MDKISSKNNEKIKFAASIRNSSKVRDEQNLFFLEGARLCSDAAESGVEIVQSFFTLSALKKYYEQCEKIICCSSESYEITTEVAEKLSDTENPQGIFSLCKSKNFSDASIKSDGKYIMLENIQDPSNLGAISRTAEALGIDGIVVCGGCDIYNPKALRASMGSALRINFIKCNSAESFLKTANDNHILTLASTPNSNCEKITDISLTGGVVCVIGNEGNGVTPSTMAVCSKKVTIPMGGRAESLNAATAAAILIWEMVRK